MKKLFLILPLFLSFACQAVPLVQPFVELGIICHDHLVGPLEVNTQVNSFVKGTLVSLWGAFFSNKFKTNTASSEKTHLVNTISLGVPLTISTVDLIKNINSLCILSRVLGFYIGKRFIEKYVVS